MVAVSVSVALVALSAWALGPTSALLAAVAVAVVAPPLARVDVAEHRLPNRLVVPALLAGLAAVPLDWLASGRPPLVPLLAAAAYAAALFVLVLGGGMGMGDVKLAAALGLASPSVTIAVLSPALAFLLGGIASVVMLIRRGTAARHVRVAFGPFLLAGYFGALAITAIARVL